MDLERIYSVIAIIVLDAELPGGRFIALTVA